MDRFSQNYLKVNCFYFPHACAVLRTVFLNRWKSLTNTEWEKAKMEQKLLITTSMNVFYQRAMYEKRIDFHLNKSDEWNLKTLSRILQNVDLDDTLSADLKRRENNMITSLLLIRIQMTCNPRYSLPDSELQVITKKIEDILTHFGAPPLTLRKLRTADVYAMIKETESSDRLTGFKTPIRVDDLKRTANKFYMEGEYISAIKFYCEALSYEKLSKIDRAVLYSNRSAAALAATFSRPSSKALELSMEIHKILFPEFDMEDFDLIVIYEVQKNAKNDAKKSVVLRPTWFRGHYRLACAYQALRKHEDALRHYDVAIKLNPTIQEMNDARDGCRKIALRDVKSTQYMSCVYKFNKLIKECEMRSVKSNAFWEMLSTSYPFDVPAINRYTAKGSKTAERLKMACKHYAKAIVFLNSVGEEANAMFVKELAQCLKIEAVTAHFTGNDKKMALDVSKKLLRRQEMSKTSELDKNIRICLAYLMLPAINLEFLDESAAKYPEEEYFQELYCVQFACFEENDEDALEQIELALKTFPKNSKLLYTKADVLRRVNDFPKKSIEAFQEFLQSVEKDDRFTPNVCYKVAFLYACQMFMFGDKKLFLDVKKYFRLGEEAERVQLPFFSLQEVTLKSALQIIIQILSHHI